MDGKKFESTEISQKILQHWDDFTLEEIDWISGDPRKLQEALVQKFGVSEDEAARQVFDFWNQHFENKSDAQTGDSSHLGLMLFICIVVL